MIGLWERLKGYAWATGCAVASVAVIGLAVALWLIDRDRDKLDLAINEPQTGYVVRLAQCQTNLAGLNTAVDQQNVAVDAYRADSARRLAEAQKAVREAQAAAVGARKRAGAVLAGRPASPSCATAEAVLRGAEG